MVTAEDLHPISTNEFTAEQMQQGYHEHLSNFYRGILLKIKENAYASAEDAESDILRVREEYDSSLQHETAVQRFHGTVKGLQMLLSAESLVLRLRECKSLEDKLHLNYDNSERTIKELAVNYARDFEKRANKYNAENRNGLALLYTNLRKKIVNELRAKAPKQNAVAPVQQKAHDERVVGTVKKIKDSLEGFMEPYVPFAAPYQQVDVTGEDVLRNIVKGRYDSVNYSPEGRTHILEQTNALLRLRNPLGLFLKYSHLANTIDDYRLSGNSPLSEAIIQGNQVFERRTVDQKTVNSELEKAIQYISANKEHFDSLSAPYGKKIGTKLLERLENTQDRLEKSEKRKAWLKRNINPVNWFKKRK